MLSLPVGYPASGGSAGTDGHRAKLTRMTFNRLEEIGSTMTDASICGLGQTASMAVLSALHHWPDLMATPVMAKGGV